MSGDADLSEIVNNWLNATKSILLILSLGFLVYYLFFDLPALKNFLTSLHITKVVTPVGEFEVGEAADSLPKSAASLQQAQAQIQSLSQSYARTLTALKQAQATIAAARAPVPAAVEQSLQAGPATLKAASVASKQIETVRVATAAAISALPKASGASLGYGIVFGADKDLAAAQNQLRLAVANKIGDPHLFKRQGYFRSVAIFKDHEGAAAALAAIQKTNKYASSAYLVNLASWCPAGSLGEDPVDCGF